MENIRLADASFVDSDFPMLTEAEEKSMLAEQVPEYLGILPLKNTVLYPGVVIPITVGRDKSIALVKEAYATKDRVVGVIAQRNMHIEDPEPTDMHRFGTMARILKLIRMPDGSITIVIQGRARFEVVEFVQEDPYFKARVNKLQEEYPTKKEAQALMRSLKRQAQQIIEISPNIPTEAQVVLQNISGLTFLVYFIVSNLNLEVTEKQQVLEMNSLLEKGQQVLGFMGKELAILELSEQIHSKVRTDLDKQQREYFLRQQIKAIHDELGEGGSEGDIETLRKRASEKVWPKRVQEVFDKEISKLARMNPMQPDHGVVLNYLDWMLDMPWQKYSEDVFDFPRTREILENDHYGLEKVKERIVEFLAVLKLKADKKAPILCFYGPPGVGKTSLGKSIASSLGREFVRISLGGLRDEAEIRGHRRTYIGAMPGRIIQGLKKAKTSNPVFMLDEIDKVGNDFRGDPSSALLEVLDPEQNDSFQDHFLEVEYDLSQVMFIATANSLATIHPALRDRMEIIEINGYSIEEKMEIAKRHLIPRARKDHGLKASQLKIADTALRRIIEGHTRESGVRNLAQKIASVCRATAKKIVVDALPSVSVKPNDIESYLGVSHLENDTYQKITSPGFSIGLAWTPTGGDILFIETSLSRGNGQLTTTGQLGDVMKESAILAHKYLKAHSKQLGIEHELFNHWDLHIHFPAGGTPKDGPSAGISIMSAIASAYTQRKVAQKLAMTGEITLRGKVLPVGGIKEKVLAAKRAGIKTLLLCKVNKKDVEEINQDYIQDLNIIYVERMDEVLEHALEKTRVPDALDLMEPVREARKRKQHRDDAELGLMVRH
ncbi:MAG: endopeptidase La [Bacteroidetes bacterium]|nr:endopeptidase La [Bacteroidota bacterium]